MKPINLLRKMKEVWECFLDWLFKPRGVDKPENILVDMGKWLDGKQLFLRVDNRRETKTMLDNKLLMRRVYQEGISEGMSIMNKKAEEQLKELRSSRSELAETKKN